MRNAFEILELSEDATPDEVKAKWKKLCMTHHPDRGGNQVKFHELKQAYEVAYAQACEPKLCPQCAGVGKVKRSHGFNSIDVFCELCGGSGHA